MRDYGYVEPEIKDEDYVLGAFTKLPKIVLQKDGNWYSFLPRYEPQFNENFDSQGCTVWGTQNVIETLLNRLTGKEYNFSERFIYILAGIRPPGADPHKIAEVIREFGLIEDRELPFTTRYEEFLKPEPMTSDLLDKGQRFLKDFSFGHEYVFKNEPDGFKRLSLMREALKYSPLGVSVTAWFENERGEFEDQGQPNNHWCVLFRIDEFDRPWIFDSYDQTIKILSKKHFIKTAKRYYVAPYTAQTKQSLVLYALSLIGKILNALRPPEPVPAVVPQALKLIQATMQPNESPRETLLRVAREQIGKDASPRDIADDDVGCAESLANILHAVNPEFPVPTLSTRVLFEKLKARPDKYRIVQINENIQPGFILVSPTGYGNGKLANGHCGVMSNSNKIMSNTSKTGLWEENYTLDSWIERYRMKGGFPLFFFEPI